MLPWGAFVLVGPGLISKAGRMAGAAKGIDPQPGGTSRSAWSERIYYAFWIGGPGWFLGFIFLGSSDAGIFVAIAALAAFIIGHHIGEDEREWHVDRRVQAAAREVELADRREHSVRRDLEALQDKVEFLQSLCDSYRKGAKTSSADRSD